MISEHIKEIRKKLAICKYIDTRLDVTRSSVNAWEMGLSIPTTRYIVDIAKIFHVPVDYILGLESKFTVVPDGYSEEEVELVLNMLKYFDTHKAK